jgi:hypothetical protein
MLIHVDDAAVCGATRRAQQGIDGLAKHFKLKHQGELTLFIGQEVIGSESGILVRQARYARELLERFGMWDCAPKPTPMQRGATLLTAKEDLLDAEDPRKTAYAEIVGGLLYLTTHTARHGVCSGGIEQTYGTANESAHPCGKAGVEIFAWNV